MAEPEDSGCSVKRGKPGAADRIMINSGAGIAPGEPHVGLNDYERNTGRTLDQ